MVSEPDLSATEIPCGPGGPRARGHGSRVWPLVVAALAAGYLALALLAPALLLAAIPVAMGAGCALAVHARSRCRGAALTAVWLAVGLAGALWWRSDPSAGLWWVVGALFLLPLPIVPWLYAAWFEERP